MTVMNIVQAINLALKQEMEKDETVLVFGEDVGRNGGVFRVTEGLQKQFGEERCFDTPLAEAGIVGLAFGMGVYGLRPVPEIQFDGFIYPAMSQIINHVARIRNRSRGRFSCPMTLRLPYTGGIHAPEHHSDSPETYLVHTPGLKVVTPSTPYEAKGLLTSSIRDPDPVMFLEPKKIYRAIKEDVPEDEYTIPLSKCNVVQEGDDVTVIGYGTVMKTIREAAKKSGVSCEVIDIRTLAPLDEKTILKSVEKTGRAVVVHEAPRTCGFASEIAALIQEKVLLDLEAPVNRVTGYDVPMPLARLEAQYLPSVDRIVNGIKETMEF